jgi:hypothetical protein
MGTYGTMGETYVSIKTKPYEFPQFILMETYGKLGSYGNIWENHKDTG